MVGRTTPLTVAAYLGLTPRETAMFLDFDGTLVDIAQHPDSVCVSPVTRDILTRLKKSTQGALAIVTGRPIADIDRFLAPLHLPVAGIYGLERRDSSGKLSTAVIDHAEIAVITERLQAFSAAHPGTMVESKWASIALHYRQCPELAQLCAAAVYAAAEDLKSLHILPGKMVIDVKGGKATKADAVAAFMAEEPFRERVPLFAGDDVADEVAFRQVARSGGISVKIGGGATAAAYRVGDITQFQNWLIHLASRFDSH